MTNPEPMSNEEFLAAVVSTEQEMSLTELKDSFQTTDLGEALSRTVTALEARRHRRD